MNLQIQLSAILLRINKGPDLSVNGGVPMSACGWTVTRVADLAALQPL